MSLFDQILATAAAPEAAANLNTVAGFAARSGLTAPTEGFSLSATADGKVAHGYQTAAVQTIIQHRRAIIGFAPGMGKTLVALAAAAHHVRAEGGRVLVICPPSLRIDPWQRELQAQHPDLTVAVLTGTKEATIPAADVLVVPDSVVLSKRAGDIVAWAPTALIIDEVQRMKSPKAGRTRAAHMIADTIATDGMVVALSGTLARNTPDDVWSPVRMLGLRAANALSGGPSFTAFQQKWCYTESIRVAGGRIVLKSVGARDGLHEALREACYVRVERDEVLDLPTKQWISRGISLSDAGQRAYQKVERDFLRWIAETKGDEAMKRASKAEAIVRLTALWEQAGLHKIDVVADYVASLTDQGEKVVVMARHISVVAALRDELESRHISVSRVVGGQSAAQKAADVDAFRNPLGTQVLIANIEAGGTGLNLECSAHLVFAQGDWSPGSIVQASDRVYRATSTRPVTIHVLNAIGTVDETIWATLEAKGAAVDQVNSGGADVTIDTGSVQDAVLASFGW